MRTVEIALIIGIGVAVASFGGTEPVSFAAVEVLFFGVAAGLALKPSSATLLPRPAYLALPVLLAVVGWLALCPLPAALLRLLAGSRNSDTGSHWGVLSFAPYETRSELLIFLACLVAFVLAMMVSGDRHRKRRLIQFLVALGAGEAFYGLIQYLANWQNIFWYAKKYDLEEATGTYINRNHFAGLLEMILPFAVCLALYQGEKLASNRRRRSPHARKLSPDLALAGLWLAVAVVLMAAVVFARSRMGLLATSASLAVVFGLNGLRRRAVPIALSVIFVTLSFALAAWIGLRPAFNRFEELGREFSGPETRLSLWPGAMRLISEHPLMGTGLGTFPVAYTAFQSTFLTKFVNHAHNDYLELSSELGIPAAFVLFASIILVLSRGIRAFLRAASRFERNILLACVGSLVAILLHSLTDFNLYIPANALVLATILGIALASSSEALHAEAAA
jgi:O-antigen ligase